MESKENITREVAILEAAREEFMSKGFAATKTTEVAKKAGVTHAMLHYYFGTKEKLFNKVFEQQLGLMIESLVLLIGDKSFPLLERIKKGVELHFDFLAQNPDLPRFIVNEIISDADRRTTMQNLIKSKIEHIVPFMQLELNQAYERGDINKIDAVDLLLNIGSLNVFIFMVLPIASVVALPHYGGVSQLLEARKKENVQMIMNRLLKDKSI